LSWKQRNSTSTTRFIEVGRAINIGMPYFVVEEHLEAMSQAGQSGCGGSAS